MKNILLTFVLFCVVSLSSSAQNITPSVENRINLLTRVMASQLGLNELEYIRLKALNRERVVKADEIAELYNTDESMITQKIQELETSFDKKFKAMLSPSQLAAYAEYKHSPGAALALTGKPNPTTTNNNQ